MADEKLPEWYNEGIEPPENKKTEGWLPTEKPPAEWFNWLFNRSYTTLQRHAQSIADLLLGLANKVDKVPGKQLSTEDYTTEEKEQLAGHEERLTTVEEEIGEGTPFQTTLLPGLNIVTVPRDTPFNVLNLTGRTLINLLGRDGNCEDISKFTVTQATIANDTANFTTGSKSLKVTISGAYTTGTTGTAATYTLKAGKFYIFVADVKNGNATQITAFLNGGTATKGAGVSSTDTTKFLPVYRAYNPASDVVVTAAAQVTGANTQYGYVDSMRLYEISAAEYAALDSMTPEQIAQRFPYTEGLRGVTGAYIMRHGKNPLPPFTEWPNVSGTVDKQNAYKISIPSGSVSGLSVDVSVLPNTTYTLSVGSGTTAGRLSAELRKEDGTVIGSGGTFILPVTSVTFTTTADTKIVRVYADNTASGVVATIENPMLNIGDTAEPFEPQNDDYMIFDATFHGNPITGVYDRLYFDENGQARKIKWFEEVVLDGSLPWVFQGDFAGFKQVEIPMPAGMMDGDLNGLYHKAVKYDGKLLQSYNSSATTGDRIWTTGGVLRVAISDTDSGFPDAWVAADLPTDWIKALTNGWKYTGTADKVTQTWVSVLDGTSSPTQTLAYVSQNKAPNWKGWASLLYQRAQAADISIADKVEGEISLHEGPNVLEVGTGIVRREAANPVLNTGDNTYYINNYNVAGSALKNRVSQYIGVYKGINKDIWVSPAAPNALGLDARKSAADYETAAAYSVTYLVLDRYLYTAPLIDLQGEYRTKLAGVVAENSQDIADLATRVSVVETQYARKQQGQWIAPVLLNGWVNYNSGMFPAGYYKDDLGVIRLKGMISSGTITGNTVLFILPVGYRPPHTENFLVASNDNSNYITAWITIANDGRVLIARAPSNIWLDLSQISFRAEK